MNTEQRIPEHCSVRRLALPHPHPWRASALLLPLLFTPAVAAEFKVADIHFETNASACDIGVQIFSDTEGVTSSSVRDPSGHTIYDNELPNGRTESFVEGVEPQIQDWLRPLGCSRSDEPLTTFAEFRSHWPSGLYTFLAKGLKSQDRLTYHIPAGPKITSPTKGAVLRDVTVRWEPVTKALLSSLGPVTIVGYHVIVEPSGSERPPEFEIDLPPTATSIQVPTQFLRPHTTYLLEVLAIEESGNQTITEGFFCTDAPCKEPK